MRALIPLLVIVLVIAAGTVLARFRGYKVGGKTVARCRSGHLFTTVWVPGASLKSIRLGFVRFQRCPVGKHWTIVRPVREADLTEQQLIDARLHTDGWVP